MTANGSMLVVDRGVYLCTCGDSTVLTYGSGATQGWSHGLRSTLSRAEIYDVSFGGYRTDNYLTDKWPSAKNLLSDYCLIQFGHNDESVVSIADYKTNLGTFCTEAIALGTIPIIVTPTHRNSWSGGSVNTDNLEDYRDAAQEAASDNSVACATLGEQMAIEMDLLGEGACAGYYVDVSHFTVAGSLWVAGILTELLVSLDPKWGSYLL
jgi:hypothetical protein